jgi:hypothetical protein
MLSAYDRVYNVQCKTFSIARELTGIVTDVTTGDGYYKPPFCLRLGKAYRTKQCQEFRNLVASIARRVR